MVIKLSVYPPLAPGLAYLLVFTGAAG